MSFEKPKIPNFTLVELCGRGASSEVWLGIDPNGIKRAIRIVSKNEPRIRVEAESRAVAMYRNVANQHRNLLDILYIGETAKCLYYVTELADNVREFNNKYEPDTLAWRIRNHQETPDSIRHYIGAILDGVEQLHVNHIAHYDLKPDNIIFVKNVLKIADPGLIARSQGTSPGGTDGYRPQWETTGIEADIFAIGKIIYVLFTKEDPLNFPEIPMNCDLRQYIGLNEIALKCCEREPAKRYRSVSEVRRDLIRLRKYSFRRFLHNLTWPLISVFLAILLLISLYIDCSNWFRNGSSIPLRISDKEAIRTLEFTHRNLGMLSLSDIDNNLNRLRRAKPSFWQDPQHCFLRRQLMDYVQWMRTFNTNDNSVFILPLLANMPLIQPEKERLKLINQYIAINPHCMDSVHTVLYGYRFHKDSGDDQTARILLDSLKNADYSKFNQYAAAFEMVKLSNYLSRHKEYQDALFFARKAEELTPCNVAVQMALFQAYFQLERYEDAMKTLRKLYSLQPQSCFINYFYNLLRAKGYTLDTTRCNLN